MTTTHISIGLRVKTVSDLSYQMREGDVSRASFKARQPNKEGSILRMENGGTFLRGLVWYIKHDDGTVGAYFHREFNPV